MGERSKQEIEAGDWVAEGLGGKLFLSARLALEMFRRIREIEAERDALRADAARYRWLRENGRMGYIWNAALHEHEKEGRWDVDAVIDAERGAQS